MQMTSTMLGYSQSHTRDSGYRGHAMSHNRNTVVDLANCAYCVILFGDILDPTFFNMCVPDLCMPDPVRFRLRSRKHPEKDGVGKVCAISSPPVYGRPVY